MDYKIIRLNTNDADIITANKKNFTFFLRHPIILNEEYNMDVTELIIDTTYSTGFGRTVTGPLIEDLYILAGTNTNWGTTSVGIYELYDQFSQRTLTFEVFINTNNVKDARLLSLTINYNFNTNGEFYILANPNPPYYSLIGPSSTLIHTSLGSGFVWGKNDDFGTYHNNLRILTEPSVVKRYKISLDNIQHLTCDYINSNRVYAPTITDIQHTHAKNINKNDNTTLTLPPQIISCIKLTVEDGDANGLTASGDNLSICLLLKKKYIKVV